MIRSSLLQRQNRFLPYALLTPALIIGAAVLAYPLINGVLLSFTEFSLIFPRYSWAGFENYRRLLSNSVYWEVFGNSITIVFISVTVQMLLGLCVSLILNSRFPGRSIFRSLIFLIWVIPEIVTALLWMIMFNSEYGFINHILYSLGIIEEFVIWLGLPNPARAAVIIVYSWRGIPFFMVMILAALQTVPKGISDAARIDGANAVQRFFMIILPFIKDILLLCGLLSIVRLFQDVTQIFILTNGGPVYSTTTLAVHVYKTAFVGFQTGTAAAVGVTWLIFLFILSIFYIRLVTKGQFQL